MYNYRDNGIIYIHYKCEEFSLYDFVFNFYYLIDKNNNIKQQ